MSLPTPVKTWQYNVNNLGAASGASGITFTRNVLFFLKNGLLGFASGAPTIGYSCNGVTAGTVNDGVDRWTTTANINPNAPGSAHSWFVFKQPGVASGFQYLISAEVIGSLNSALTLSCWASPSAGFTGGTTTARPTATDEVAAVNTTAPTYFGGGTGTSTSTAYRMHLMQSTDGSCMRFIICMSSIAAVSLVIDTPSNTVTGWSNPFICWGGGNANTFPTTANMNNSSFSQENGTTLIPKTVIAGTTASCILTSEGSSTLPGFVSTIYGTFANEVDLGWSIWPMGIASITAGVRGRIGSMTDMWWGSRGAITGDTYDVTSKTFAQFGDLIVPWNGTVPLIA